jgi:DNA-binding CsgD family transcriptional regulator
MRAIISRDNVPRFTGLKDLIALARSGAKNGNGDGGKQGFLVVDASLRVLCANDEAIRILTYQSGPGLQRRPQQLLDEKVLRTLLHSVATASGPGVCYQSGRRSYFCRALPLSATANGRKASETFLLVLQRGEHKGASASETLEQFRLTPREREVVTLLMEGLCNKDIAHRMAVSVATVKAFLRAITMKMEVSGRGEIVAKVLARALPGTVPTNGDFERALHSAKPSPATLSRNALLGTVVPAKDVGPLQQSASRLRLERRGFAARGNPS